MTRDNFLQFLNNYKRDFHKKLHDITVHYSWLANKKLKFVASLVFIYLTYIVIDNSSGIIIYRLEQLLPI